MTDFNQNLIAELRANRGQVTSGPFLGRRLLILTTTGAKTGQRRETPLVYSTDGDRFVVVASKGGAPSNPAWYHNIAAESAVTVEVDGERFPATATIADAAERRRLYDAHAALYPTFTEYEARTDRVIPVIALQRRAASVAA